MKNLDECAYKYPDIHYIPISECQECKLRDLPEEDRDHCCWGNEYLKSRMVIV